MAVKPKAKPIPPVELPKLPSLTDVLAAIGAVNKDEIERIVKLLVERYPNAEILAARGQDFLNAQFSGIAIQRIQATVWAEALAAVATRKSVIVTDPVDLA